MSENRRTPATRQARRKMTPKQRVLRKCPTAFAMKRSFGVVIYREHAFGDELGSGPSYQTAWKLASMRIAL